MCNNMLQDIRISAGVTNDWLHVQDRDKPTLTNGEYKHYKSYRYKGKPRLCTLVILTLRRVRQRTVVSFEVCSDCQWIVGTSAYLASSFLKTNQIQNYNKPKGERVDSTSWSELGYEKIFQKDLFLKIGEISTTNLAIYGCAVSTLKFSVETSWYLTEMVIRNVDPIKWYKVRIPFAFSCLYYCA